MYGGEATSWSDVRTNLRYRSPFGATNVVFTAVKFGKSGFWPSAEYTVFHTLPSLDHWRARESQHGSVSRRSAQLLLERFDADGLTRRVGDERVLRRAARQPPSS